MIRAAALQRKKIEVNYITGHKEILHVYTVNLQRRQATILTDFRDWKSKLWLLLIFYVKTLRWNLHNAKFSCITDVKLSIFFSMS